MDQRAADKLNGQLGVLALSSLVVANMIGAGIYLSTGYSMAALGNPSRVMLAWSVCGAWAISGAVAYGALAKRLPFSGGEYLYLSRLVHPSIGVLAGWISIIAGFGAPLAAAAKGAAIYCLPSSQIHESNIILLAIIFLTAGVISHWFGMSLGATVQNAIVAIKLTLVTVLIVWAFFLMPSANWQGAALAGRNEAMIPSDGSEWTAFLGSLSWVVLSYTGFNAAVYVAGEAREAKKRVAPTMLLATVVVTVFYLLLNYIYVYATPPDLIAGMKDVAAIAARHVGGSNLEAILRVAIVLSMCSSIVGLLCAGPTVMQQMAMDRNLPNFMDGLVMRPRGALVVQASVALAAICVANILQLMSYLGLTLSACGALSVASLWWAAKSAPESPALRWYEALAASFYLALTATIVVISYQTHRNEFWAMLATFALGIIVYLASNRRPSDAAAAESVP